MCANRFQDGSFQGFGLRVVGVVVSKSNCAVNLFQALCQVIQMNLYGGGGAGGCRGEEGSHAVIQDPLQKNSNFVYKKRGKREKREKTREKREKERKEGKEKKR